LPPSLSFPPIPSSKLLVSHSLRGPSTHISEADADTTLCSNVRNYTQCSKWTGMCRYTIRKLIFVSKFHTGTYQSIFIHLSFSMFLTVYLSFDLRSIPALLDFHYEHCVRKHSFRCTSCVECSETRRFLNTTAFPLCFGVSHQESARKRRGTAIEWDSSASGLC
jgi:hypothetical protein